MGSSSMAKAKVCVLVAVLALASTAAAIETWTATLEQRLGKTKTTELAAKKAAAKKGAAAAYHWGYETATGPKTWAVKYPDCGKKQQSPINIITKKVDQTNHKQPFQMRLPTVKAKTLQILNNGHTIEVRGDNKPNNNGLATSNMLLNGQTYYLQQFHFHHKSENRINSKQFPMEAHFVAKDRKGHILVVSVLIAEGKTDNPFIKALDWGKIKTVTKKDEIGTIINADIGPFLLFPPSMEYYYYEGSFTTPPCTQGVKWVVMMKQGYASKKQIAAFPFKNNFRPPQPLNGRKVLLSTTAISLARKLDYKNEDNWNGYGSEYTEMGENQPLWPN